MIDGDKRMPQLYILTLLWHPIDGDKRMPQKSEYIKMQTNSEWYDRRR